MIEKVNPSHPDKIADRIAGAIVDLAYRHEIVVRHCGYAATEQSAPPFTKDRDARMTLKTLYGAFQPTEVSAAHPPQNRAHTATQEGAGGAVYHTRIKSKRVDKEE